MTQTTTSRKSLRGFSLLELSIVLAIISLLAGAGLTMAINALKSADRITTQERLTTIKLAIDSYAKTYGYLPCPFDRSLTPSSTSFGVENRTAGSTNCGATNGTSYINSFPLIVGGVPVRTLGLPDSYASDAWGNKFTYSTGDFLKNDSTSYATRIGQMSLKYGPNASNYFVNTRRLSPAPTYTNGNSGGNANITLNNSVTAGTVVHIIGTVYKGSYFARTTGLTTRLCTNAALTTYLPYDAGDAGGTAEWISAGDDVAYTVVSHGPDGRGAFPLRGTAVPTGKLCNTSATANSSPAPCTSSATTTCIDIENCDNDITFSDSAYNDSDIAAEYFDDFIVWGSNVLRRPPITNSLYSSCGTNPCEPWCAVCDINYPGGDSAVPPAAITGGDAVLCKKVITSNSTDCKAACFWAGTTAAGYQQCQ